LHLHVLSFVLLAACQSKITGTEGNLSFAYVADDDIRNFNKPIAVGAKLDLTVTEVGTDKKVELQAAKADPETVLRAASFSGNTVVLEGKGSGSALVSVEAKVPSGTVVKDSVNMLARAPEVLKLAHTCTADNEGRYLVGQDVWVPFDLEMKNGQAVIGYGYFPVDVLPATAMTLDLTSRDQAFLHIKTGATKGSVTLQSKIDSTTIKVSLVEQGDADGALANPLSPKEIEVGKTLGVHVLPTVSGKPVCQARSEVTVATGTPTICTAVLASGSTGATANPQNEWGFVNVTGKAVGKCTFNVTHVKGKAGAGVTTPITVDIIQVVRP
jgi:hypothetical protein